MQVPIAEFDLLATTLTSSQPAEELSALDGPLCFVVTEGNVRVTAGSESVNLSKGQAGFVRANIDISLEGPGEVWGAFYQ